MAFTYDISTDRGKVRFNLGDTVEANSYFTDAEIDYLLSSNGDNVLSATIAGCLNLFIQFSRFPSTKKIKDLSISYGDLANNFNSLYKKYKALKASNDPAIPYAGGISESDKETYEDDTDRVTPFFTRSTFDNALDNEESNT